MKDVINPLLELWGVRGTAPAAGPERVRFGGHTICSRIQPIGNEQIVIDAGSGMIPLGRRIMRERRGKPGPIHLLLTHFHLDHIIGLPFFAPLYVEGTEVIVYSPLEPQVTERCLTGLMEERYFPIELREAPAKLEYRRFPAAEGLTIGEARITAHSLKHPQGSVAFRVERGHDVWVMATDTEHPEQGVDKSLAEFCRGADLLVCDATFTPEEYRSRKGWGHSTWEEGIHLAEAAGVERLVLSHLNPDHNDDMVARMEKMARDKFPGARAAVEVSSGGWEYGGNREEDGA